MNYTRCARRRFLLAAAVAVSPIKLLSSAYAQQTFPTRAVQLVVPFPPGGVTDALARLLGNELQAALGQPFIVINKPGASGAIAAEFVKGSPADGYTLMMGHIGTHAVNPALYKKLPYNPVTDFAPISLSWSSFFVQTDRLFDCRFLLESIGWQVAQCGVQPLAVVEADD
uniref:Bug family tripartite tricarboxylate transporter substrate binding protein n=1 Tax=Rhodoferax ferrireducens TaxID=192843 RepID=UPI0022B822B0